MAHRVVKLFSFLSFYKVLFFSPTIDINLTLIENLNYRQIFMKTAERMASSSFVVQTVLLPEINRSVYCVFSATALFVFAVIERIGEIGWSLWIDLWLPFAVLFVNRD